MSGSVDWWAVFIFFVGVAGGLIAAAVAVVVWVARMTWWLSEEFKETRHASANDIAAAKLDLGRRIDSVDERDIREHEEMQKQLNALSVQIAKRR